MNKKYFSLDLTQSKYNALSKEEKILVETGYNLVKKYAADLGKRTQKKSFIELIEDDGTVQNYKNLNDKYMTKLMKYCLKKAGCDVENFTLKDIANPQLHTKTLFVETFTAVLSQVMSPVLPAMISAEFADLADTRNIAYGETARFIVKSNDTFFVSRHAEGILHGTIQRVFNDELTVNPEPYTGGTAFDWYQVSSGVVDFGEMVYRIGVSFSQYINQMIVRAIQTNIQDGITNGIPYFANGFTTQKFTTLAEKLSAANNRATVRAYGTLSALSAILPSGANGSEIANMQIGLGNEWATVGHLAKYMGIDLVRIPQILLPNTVNTSALFGLPNDVVYMFADGGYKPVKLVFEGQPVTVKLAPMETADKQLGLEVQMRIGQTFVAASKFGALVGVSLA